jgi:8-oxo-dGTP pyrophosphatase MutT (NUDIX family)
MLIKHIDGNQTEVATSDLVFSVHLYAIVVRDGRVLISPQWADNGYDFPGGHLELGEHHIDGLIRETREETGFTVKPLHIIDIFTSYFIHPIKKTAQQAIKIYYACEIVSGEISTDGFCEFEKTYAAPARFATLSELRQMKFVCTCQKPLDVIFPYLQKMGC